MVQICRDVLLPIARSGNRVGESAGAELSSWSDL